MFEDNARIPINMTEPVELNLKMESYTLIGDADDIYNKGYADGEEYGKQNAPTEDLAVTLTSNGAYSYEKPTDKYYADVEVVVDVPSDKMPTQEKSITITENGSEVISPDIGYVLDKVTVVTDIDTRLPEQEKSLEVTENKVYEVTPDDGYALKKVTVTGNVASSGDNGLLKVTTYTADEYNSLENTKLNLFTNFIKEIDCTEYNKLGFSSLASFFEDYQGESLVLKNLDTSNVTSMAFMFGYTERLRNIDLGSSFDTSKVTTMQGMFFGSSFKDLNKIANWDVKSVTTFQSMFGSARSLSTVDLSQWETNSLTTTKSMFSSGTVLGSVNLSGWNTSKLVDMDSMFSYDNYLTTVNFDGWDTSNVTKMSNVFINCSRLANITFGNSWASNNAITLFDVHYSPLSKESILDLAAKIADKSNKTIYTNTYTVKLKSSQKSLFTEEELTALASQFTAKNWTLAWS